MVPVTATFPVNVPSIPLTPLWETNFPNVPVPSIDAFDAPLMVLLAYRISSVPIPAGINQPTRSPSMTIPTPPSTTINQVALVVSDTSPLGARPMLGNAAVPGGSTILPLGAWASAIMAARNSIANIKQNSKWILPNIAAPHFEFSYGPITTHEPPSKTSS